MPLKSFLFFLYTLSAIVICFLPLYLHKHDFSKIEIGIAMAVALAFGTASNLLVGMLSDKRQMLKSMMLLLIILQLLCAAVMFLSETKLIIWIAMQCFFVAYTPLASMSDSLIMLVTSKSDQSYMSYRLWGSLGFAAGAVVVGWLLQQVGIDAIFWVYFMLTLLTFLFGRNMPERKPHPSGIRFAELGQIIRTPTVYLFLIVIFILALSHRMNDHYLGLFLQSLGAGETLIGWSWLISALSEIPVFLLLAKYGARFNPLRLLAIAATLYCARFVLMMFVENPAMALLVQAMHSVTFGIFLYAAISWLQIAIPERFRATGQAIFTITWVSLSGITASLAGGQLFDSFGAKAMFFTASALAFVAAICFLVLSYFLRRTQPINQ